MYSARHHLKRNIGQGNEERMVERWFNEIIFDGAKILELGAGKGNFIKRLENSGKDIECYGVDISEENLKIAREQTKIKSPYLLIDISREPLPWADNYFDAVVGMEFSEHLENPVGCFLEIQRVLKKDSNFLYSYPLESEISGAKGPILNHKERKFESGFHSFVYQGLYMYENHRAFCNQFYFKIEDEEKVQYHMFWKMKNTKKDKPCCVDLINIDWNTEDLYNDIWTDPKYKEIM